VPSSPSSDPEDLPEAPKPKALQRVLLPEQTSQVGQLPVSLAKPKKTANELCLEPLLASTTLACSLKW
jgi:hypothetical protein